MTSEEVAARARVAGFMAEVSLEPGDVIEVPTGVPHGLQHGIRVIEFQTPTYERQIVYAAQQVLTQSAWDSAAAIAGLTLDAPPSCSPKKLSDEVEVLAETGDFRLFRARLKPGGCWAPPGCAYAVALAAAGSLRVGSRQGSVDLEARAAAFIPGSAADVALTSADGGELLLAIPGRSNG